MKFNGLETCTAATVNKVPKKRNNFFKKSSQAKVMPHPAKQITFCWELGGGLGHLGPIHPLAQSLNKRGLDVAVISRDLQRAEKLFSSDLATVHQAPYGNVEKQERIDAPANYAEMLHNSGWSGKEQLENLVDSWRELFGHLRPDYVICDHSPTARLAAHSMSLPAATLGTGFCCPPNLSPLPRFRAPSAGQTPTNMAESKLLNRMNTLLHQYGQEHFGSFAELLHRNTHHFLTTFQELDHYRQRPLQTYRGTWSFSEGAPPQWPSAPGKLRAIAYLKPFAYLAELLSVLVYQGVSVLVYCPGVSQETRDRLSLQRRIVFADKPIDFTAALAESDFAVFNAGHASTVTALRAGKPILQVPLNMEQSITAQRITEMNAGRSVDTQRPLNYAEVVEDLLQLISQHQAAQAFAARYQNYDSRSQIESIVDEIEMQAAGTAPTPNYMAEKNHGKEKTQPEITLGLSPSQKMLSDIVKHFSQFASTSILRQPLPLLPWQSDSTDDAQLIDRLHRLSSAYPGVSLVGDVGVSYLPYARRILTQVPNATFLCAYLDEDDLVAEYLTHFATYHPGRPINHWSEDRAGFENHPLDQCYPGYPTRDLVEAITEFHRDYFTEAETLTQQYPDRFQMIDAATLPKLRHIAISQPEATKASAFS